MKATVDQALQPLTPPQVDRARAAWPVSVSVVLAVLLVPLAWYGLFFDEAYRGYSADVVLTSRAGDLLTLLVLPLLVFAGIRSRRGSLRAHVVWLGLLFYLAYSYALYLIGWQHNRAFLGYAVVVTLSSASLVDGLVRLELGAVAPAFRRLHSRAVGWFLLAIGVSFTGLWLSDVLPSVYGGRAPVHLGVGGTPYAVYVLDLVVALPTVVVTGLMLVRCHPAAPFLGGVVLVKITTLFTSLWLGTGAQVLAGRHVAFTPDMVPGALLLIGGVILLLVGSRRLEPPRDGWLRPELWHV